MQKNKLFDTELEIAALGVLGAIFLETIAILKGVDGNFFGATMVCIGGIVGWVFKEVHLKIRKK